MNVFVVMNDIWYQEDEFSRNLINVYKDWEDALKLIQGLDQETINFLVDGKIITIKHKAFIVIKEVL